MVLRLIGAILNAFCTNLGLIYYILAEIGIFRKCAKIRSVSGECFAPICVHVSRRHVHSVISFLICSKLCSKMVLRIAGAIHNAFRVNMGLICRIAA